MLQLSYVLVAVSLQRQGSRGCLMFSQLSMEKAMAPHSSTLAWKIPWKEEPSRLQSMGLQRVGHDWVTWLSLHALEKEMAPHSSVLAWRIPGMAEPGERPSLGSHRVRHDWSDLAAAAMGMMCSLIVVLVFISLMMLNIFSYIYWSFLYFLQRNTY